MAKSDRSHSEESNSTWTPQTSSPALPASALCITEALDAVPLGRFMAGHLLTMIVAMASLAAVHEAAAYSLWGMKEHLRTTDSGYARLTAVFQIGAAIGCFAASLLADNWGRRATAIVSSFTGAILHYAAGTAGSMAYLDWLRFAQAICYALCMASMNTWYVEFLPTRHRGQLLSALCTGWPIGRGMTIVVSKYFGSAWFATWYLAGALQLLVAVIMLFAWESPRFLLISGDQAKAHQVLASMHAASGGSWDQRVHLTMAGTDEETTLFDKGASNTHIFSRINSLVYDHGRLLFFIMVVFACLASTSLLLDTWGPLIFQRLFDTDTPQSIMMLFNMGDLGGIFVSIAVADMVGRRGSLFLGFFMQAFLLAATAQTSKFLTHTASLFYVPLFFGTMASGCRCFAWEAASMWLSEVFPTHLRVTAMAVVMPVMRLLSVVTLTASGELIERASPAACLAVISVLLFLSGVFVAVCFPFETANVPMSESRRWHAK
eukprot:CAMPEP_0170208290 /NCGR_PEP_ID=MMETSP0116_2-20130129/3729_1 /TAXON_ID=400756 /ORGANISM="Durinskia baltica, Strain CSIRO CS-38" /LENGTH=490 /DNA_ID=CAMNT_0010458761 /DNA_START=68 /DNA_END=1540 /DNA_ORIENTATION=-